MKNYTVRKKKNTKKGKLFNRIVKGGSNEEELSQACISRDFDAVQKLVEKGADVNYKWDGGFSILHAACYGGDYDIIKLILDKGADVNASDKYKNTPLNMAIWNSHSIEVIMALLDRGADVNASDIYKNTPLFLAIRNSSIEVIMALLDRGADVNAINKEQDTPLHIAIKFISSIKVSMALLDRGADVNAIDKNKNTPLHLACKRWNIELVNELIKKGADVNIINDEQNTPLHIALQHNYQDIIMPLLDKGADVNITYFEQDTPLHFAVKRGWIELVNKLIEKGADINASDHEGNTPLHIAIWYSSRIEIIMALLDRGADINASDHEGNTPLHTAIWYSSRIEIIMALLDRGADINASDHEGNTPLHLACKKGNIELVNKIINKGADINAIDKNKNTPLHLACKNGNIELVNKLIKKGADINVEDAFGEIPFHYIDLNDYKEYGLDPQDEKLRSRFYKDGVYELRKFKEIDIPIMVIPRGTLLFRSVQEGIDDFCGIPNGDKYCMNKNYNVFFYPYPAYREDKFKIFVVEKTLKIVNLIYPSYLSREVRLKKKYDFIQSCDEVERDFCGVYIGYRFDPCFSEEFLKENPDIAGMITLAVGDLEKQKNQYTDLNKYSIFHRDVRGKMGVPELILYPKQTRQISDKYWSEQECVEGIRNYSYLIDSKNYQENIMESLLNPKGYNIQRRGIQSPFTQTKYDTIHVTLYNPLKMYVVWEYLEENYTKDCVPINWSAKSKLSQFQTDINRTNDGLYDKIFTTFKKFKGMNNIIGRGGKSRNGKTKRNKTRKKSNK